MEGRHRGAESAETSTPCFTWGTQPQWGKIPRPRGNSSTVAKRRCAADHPVAFLKGGMMALPSEFGLARMLLPLFTH